MHPTIILVLLGIITTTKADSVLRGLYNLRSFLILYERFLLMYKKAPPALDWVGVCLTEQFARAMFVGKKLVFEMRDSIIPRKSKSLSISVRSAWSWSKYFEREQIWWWNIERLFNFMLLGNYSGNYYSESILDLCIYY